MAAKSPEAIAKRMSYQRRYRRENHEREAPLARAWTDRNLSHRHVYATLRRLCIRYGLTGEEYNTILHSQNFCCAICGVRLQSPSWGKRGSGNHALCAVLDHKEKTVRGILCSNCNVGIGMFGDNSKSLARAIEYLLDNGRTVRATLGREK